MNHGNFDSLGISATLCRALAEIGYDKPTSIQAQAIPRLLEGHDLLGIAQTGTGKTAAFSLPILELLTANRMQARSKQPTSLILSPTRELALQIHDEILSFNGETEIRLACIFGGVKPHRQIRALERGVEILVATPGRLLDLVNGGHVDLSAVSHLVLDEADRLLDMGFIRDVKKIIRMIPRDRQALLFSATMPRAIADLAREFLSDPVRIDVTPNTVTVEEIDQGVQMVETHHKQQMLEKMLFDPDVSRAIVFTRTKHGANRVAKRLERAGITAEAIHGNKSQNARTKALQSFKSGSAWVLVATDVAARGIDIQDVSHVINFELPHEPESYVHRIGRTARAGATGVAWSLVDPSETKRLRAIERLTRQKPKLLDLPTPEADPAPDTGDATNVRTVTGNREHSGESSKNGSRRRGGRRRRRRQAA